MKQFSPLSFSKIKNVKKKIIKCDNNCINCCSKKTFPYENNINSMRYCEKCKIDFKPRIVSVNKCVEKVQ